MRALESRSLWRRIESGNGFRDGRRRSFECGEKGNRSRGGHTAEGAVLEMRASSRVKSRVVVQVMHGHLRRRHRRLIGCRT